MNANLVTGDDPDEPNLGRGGEMNQRRSTVFEFPLSQSGEEPLTIPFGLALVLGTYWCWFMFLNDPQFFPFLTQA